MSDTSKRGNILASLRNVRFSHDSGETWVLDGIDLDIHEGERICLIGPNGAGKSTLARLVAGLSAPDSGTITLLGQTVFEDGSPHADRYRKARRGIGIVFQNPADQLITTVTEDDTAFGPENLGLNHAEIGKRVHAALDAVEMGSFMQADPTRLSGGQQQRIALAGTLAMDPKLIVLDEPTAMLDEQAQADVLRILDGLQRRGTAILHITHKTEELRRADRVLVLDHGSIHTVSAQEAIAGREREASAERTAQDNQDLAQTPVLNLAASADEATQAGRAAQSNADAVASTKTDTSFKTVSFAKTQETGSATAEDTSDLSSRSSSTSPIINVSHVSMRYAKNPTDILHDFSMSVSRGETVAIMGRNGSGKTTLTRLLTALSKPSEGSITIDGLDLGHLDRKGKRRLRGTVGLVMQQPERQLFADTVLEDVAYGPKNQGLGDDKAIAAAMQALELLGIDSLADRSPFSLSGGQQRLAAIAGIIAVNPPVLIMDEPNAGLDLKAAGRINALIETLHRRGTTIVLVTHDPAQAKLVGARIIRLDGNGESKHSKTSATQPIDEAQTTEKDNGFSIIERLDPRVKIVAFLVLLFTGFTVSTPWQLLLAAIMTAGVALASRINPVRLLGSLKAFIAMFIVLGVLNMLFIQSGTVIARLGPVTITDNGLYDAVLYSVRLALVLLLGVIMLRTTTPTKLTDGFGSLLSPLHHFGLHSQEIALVMSLALRFLPTLAAEAHDIVDAQSARGGSIETGTPAKRVKAMAAIIVPVFTGALRHSDNLALALDARCYEADIARTHWRVMKVGGRDYAFIAVCALYLVALFLLGRGASVIWI